MFDFVWAIISWTLILVLSPIWVVASILDKKVFKHKSMEKYHEEM